MTRILPLHNNLILKPFELGEVTKSGLLIPQIAKASTPYRYAKVIEVGPGRRSMDGTLIPVNIATGEVVAYSKNRGVEFPLDDEDGTEQVVLMINEQDVLGIVKDMPERSKISGIDGRLLTMQPGSRGMADSSLANLDQIARSQREGLIDSSGTYLDDMARADRADHEGEPS